MSLWSTLIDNLKALTPAPQSKMMGSNFHIAPLLLGASFEPVVNNPGIPGRSLLIALKPDAGIVERVLAATQERRELTACVCAQQDSDVSIHMSYSNRYLT